MIYHYSQKLAGRPIILHGNQDEIVPFEDTAEFVSENPDLNLTFVEEDEVHLIKFLWVTEFFVKEINNNYDLVEKTKNQIIYCE